MLALACGRSAAEELAAEERLRGALLALEGAPSLDTALAALRETPCPSERTCNAKERCVEAYALLSEGERQVAEGKALVAAPAAAPPDPAAEARAVALLDAARAALEAARPKLTACERATQQLRLR